MKTRWNNFSPVSSLINSLHTLFIQHLLAVWATLTYTLWYVNADRCSCITFASHSLQLITMWKRAHKQVHWLLSVDGFVVYGGDSLFLMAPRSHLSSEWREGQILFFPPHILLKTKVAAGSLAFLRRLQDVRESDPWAPFSALDKEMTLCQSRDRTEICF